MISQLGRYNIIGELGQGAMGTVYKAVDPLIDRIVAIKTINLSLAMDEKDEYESRFYQEAKAAGRLSHPNIVTIYDVGKSGEIAYIAMEFLQGRELRDILNDGKRMPVEQVINIVAQVAQGLA
jgi:serine/threonine protein kinase